eukprot:2851112-Amphidinium_carterae.1
MHKKDNKSTTHSRRRGNPETTQEICAALYAQLVPKERTQIHHNTRSNLTTARDHPAQGTIARTYVWQKDTTTSAQ